MGHLPDPYTTNTLDSGVTVHYTNYKYGKVDFAILEARKFKNIGNGDSLLGVEQEEWLESWCHGTTNSNYKIILTQTPFSDQSTLETNWNGVGVHDKSKAPSVDSNGAPLPGRERFMQIIQGCSNLILAGDQHL